MAHTDSDPSETAPAPHAAPPMRSPALAAALALILPGIGQLYLGRTLHAFVVILSLFGCVYGITQGALFPFLFLAPFVYVLSAVDAHHGARELNRHARAAAVESAEPSASPWWGAGLTALGVVLLLHSLGWIDVRAWQRFWPVLLISVGTVSLYASHTRRTADQGRAALPPSPGSY